ncbi:hypothetical protein Syun_025581 [Stephania yunnanensis]|uniref:Uncharacterized protein n=1 Tax=Stephania yunnanensis TaxID=152371 RepID=A0AAP0HVX1_9MAGN
MGKVARTLEHALGAMPRHDPWTDHGVDHPLEPVGLDRPPASTRGAWAAPRHHQAVPVPHDQGSPEYQEHVAIDPVMVAVMERCGSKGARQLVVKGVTPWHDALPCLATLWHDLGTRLGAKHGPWASARLDERAWARSSGCARTDERTWASAGKPWHTLARRLGIPWHDALARERANLGTP